MVNLRIAAALLTAAAALASGRQSQAAQHLWNFKEFYSNHDGSVQFIEFFTTFSSQQFLDAHKITATSTVDGTPTVRTFTFDDHLSTSPPNPSTTANKHMLIATEGFAALAGGVTPDYFLPAGDPFFNPDADSITFAFGPPTGAAFDTVVLAGANVPKDGVASLSEAVPSSTTQTYVAGTNSPTNFQSTAGSVNLPPPSGPSGNFDGLGVVDGADLVLWKGGYGVASGATFTQGDADSDGDVDGRDFLVWQRSSGSAPALAAAAVPEPGGLLLLAIAAGAASAAASRSYLGKRR